MPSENSSDGQSVYMRLALLIVGEAIAGIVLYALTTLLPAAILATVAFAAWAIVKLDRVSRKNKSLASHFCAVTCLLTALCSAPLWLTHWHENVLWRLVFVGVCLGAGLILLDRRADDWR